MHATQDQEESKSNDTMYPAFCAIQNDWEYSLQSQQNNDSNNQFWISLIQKNNCYVDATVNIDINKANKQQLISKLIVKKGKNDDTKTNDMDNLDWNMKLLPFNKDSKLKYYAEIKCSDKNLNNYHLIPSYKQMTDKKDIHSTKVSINCLDIAESSYFKRWYISSALQDGTINIYDVESSKLKMKCTGHSGHVTKCKFFPFGDLILSGDTKGILNIYAIADPKGKPAVTFHGHKGDISCINFIGEGSEVLSGAADNTVILWNCSTQKNVLQFGELGLSTINEISVINDDKILITGSSNGYLTFYDIKTGKQIVNIKGCNGDNIQCHSVLNRNNHCIMTTDENGMCYIYDIRKLDGNDINCIGKIQRDEKCIKKIINDDNDNGNELILFNSLGNIWKWKLDINKDIGFDNVTTMTEWTGNEQFGVNDVVIMNNKNKNDKRMFVATKNYQIKEYLFV